jgi:two-component system CheB/CheR fusion protein
MPRSAVEAGAVDHALPPEEIARSLAELANAAVPEGTGEDHSTDPDPPLPPSDVEVPFDLSPSDAAALEAILATLMKATGVDFRHYKRPSMARRVRRRVEDLGVQGFPAYASLLQENTAEIQALFSSALIHVTGFFREPGMYGVLQDVVIPSLLADRPSGAPLRVWVVGCATGEEAYSTAITFLEFEGALQREIPVKIFASDLSAEAIATARAGRYSAGIAQDLSPERLTQFFLPVDGGFQVEKRLREMCIFAQQDVTRDPPFANLDLVICRNLLIYLEPVLQRRVLHALHYALRSGGFLALGMAESVPGHDQLFAPLDRKNRVYLRRSTASRLDLDVTWKGQQRGVSASWLRGGGAAPVPWTTAELLRAAAHTLFTRSPTGSVIVTPDLEIRHFQGRTSPYLEPPTGGPTANLLKMAHPDFRLALGRLLRKAQQEHREVSRRGLPIKVGKRTQYVTVRVFPIPTDETEREHYLVVFESVARPRKGQSDVRVTDGSEEGEDQRSLELEQELAETRDYLQAIVEQQDETHAELQAAYEASLSANEEFQSTNEELESTKEELQSVNEELTTVNEQLQHRNAELSARASEFGGLLEAMDMPILLMDPDRRLQAFNARAAGEMHLTPSHIGRRLTEAQSPVPLDDLERLVAGVMAQEGMQELELQDRDGRWYALRVWPVTATTGLPTGVVAALVDISRLKQDIERAAEREAFHSAVVEAMNEPLVVLSEDLHVLRANQAFCSRFKVTPDQVVGQLLWQLDEGAWDQPELRILLEGVVRTGEVVEKHELSFESPSLGRSVFLLSARRVSTPHGSGRGILLALLDVTRRRAAEQQMIAAGRMQAVGQLAGGVAHEINNQMTSVLGFADLLSRSLSLSDAERADFSRIAKAAGRAAEITRQLLAFSRQQFFAPSVVDLNALVATSEALILRTLGDGLSLALRLGEDVGEVRVDQAQFEQILVNLASNARDAMTPGGSLTIETSPVTVRERAPASPADRRPPRGTYARLVVRDTGTGMSQEVASRIFEPFFTTKPQGIGTGLGLASVYGMIKQSGGYIWVESEEGKGTTFIIDLPRAIGTGRVEIPAEPVVAPRGNETVLIVEDGEPVRLWLFRALQDLGYNVLRARDGEEALEFVRTQGAAIAVVISDVVMAGISGAELSSRLAEIQPALPVILMSAYGSDELYARRIVPRGIPVMMKPFDVAELASLIRRVVDAPAGRARR